MVIGCVREWSKELEQEVIMRNLVISLYWCWGDCPAPCHAHLCLHDLGQICSIKQICSLLSVTSFSSTTEASFLVIRLVEEISLPVSPLLFTSFSSFTDFEIIFLLFFEIGAHDILLNQSPLALQVLGWYLP